MSSLNCVTPRYSSSAGRTKVGAVEASGIQAGHEGSSAPSTGWLVEFAALARVGNASFLASALATEVVFRGERVVCAAAKREVLLGR
jgi:hypothetical protein